MLKPTDMIRTICDNTKNTFGSSIHCKNPKRILVVPAKKVPYKKSFRDPMLSMYLPNIGKNTMVVTNAQP